MKEATKITRRGAMALTAGAVAAVLTEKNWVFALNREGVITKVASDVGAQGWKPILFTQREAEGLARLCEAIIPRTDTPGAREARVHEYIDLAVSVEDEAERKRFLKGFKWLGKRCRKKHGEDLAGVGEEELVALLHSISDHHDEVPKKLETGAEFFTDLKRRTVFGYYTSETGRVEELGLPGTATMEKYRGCRHRGGEHRGAGVAEGILGGS